MWLLIALLGNAMLAAVAIIDKFILSKSVSKPIIFVFYSTIFVLPICLLLPFGINLPSVCTDYLLFGISGFCFALALWTLYIAIQSSEISHVGPLVGAAMPFFILLLSRVFLGERLGPYGLLAASILIIGSLIISFDLNEKKPGWHISMSWGVLAGFLFAVSHVIAKYSYDIYGFYSGFILTKLPIGIFGAILFFTPPVRALFAKKQATSAGKKQSKKLFALVVCDIGLGVIGSILLQYATALGSVTLVNALGGAQFAMLIIFVALISKFFPKILHETFTKKEIIQKTTAVGVISLGLVLLLIK